MAAANKKIGPARYKAYGNLDILLTQELRAVGGVRQPQRA